MVRAVEMESVVATPEGLTHTLWVATLGTNGGTERFVHGYARWLLQRNEKVDIVCFHQESPLIGATTNVLQIRGRGRLWKMRARNRALLELGSSPGTISFLRGGKAPIHRAGGGSHRRWSSIDGRTLADRLELDLEQQVMDSAKVVVVNSEMAKADLLSTTTLSPERVHLIRNGVDLNRFQPKEGRRKPGPPRLLFFGNGFHRKGLDVAIEVLTSMSKALLTVVGHDVHWTRFQKHARNNGVENRVSFTGTHPNPEQILADHDVLLLPSRYDSAANVCLEALSCGVPVITTPTNGMSEILPFTWMVVERNAGSEIWGKAIEKTLSMPNISTICRASAMSWPAEGSYRSLFELVCSVGG